MSTTINAENAKSIRQPMEVHCGISSRNPDVDLTVSASGGIALKDSNVSVSIDTEEWSMREITDLAGDGFALDGTAEWVVTKPASEEDGKLGIRTNIGGQAVISVSSAKVIDALTIDVSSGSGKIIYNQVEYTASRQTVVPIGSKTATLTVRADADSRMEIAAIVPGIVIQFDNSNLISCELNLVADLKPVDYSLPISSIEINGYIEQGEEIEKVLANMPDGTAIWYYAGYPGDYSETRRFYLSEKVNIEQHQVTIKGEDAVSMLADYTADEQMTLVKATNGRSSLYLKMKNVLKSAGVSLAHIESTPSSMGKSTVISPQVFKEQRGRDVIAHIMQLCRFDNANIIGTFYPRYVDAGIPSLSWHKPATKWTIREDDCGEVSTSYDRSISKVHTTDRYGLNCKLAKKTSKTVFSNISYEKGDISTYSFSNCFAYGVTVSNATIIESRPSFVTFKVKADGKCKISGYKVYNSSTDKSMLTGERGQKVEIQPSVYGYINACNNSGATQRLFPRYQRVGNINTKTGSFVWKGDPRMQPRDVFELIHLDGSTETCTIESIVLTHSEGGTRCTLNYRKGVL